MAWHATHVVGVRLPDHAEQIVASSALSAAEGTIAACVAAFSSVHAHIFDISSISNDIHPVFVAEEAARQLHQKLKL